MHMFGLLNFIKSKLQLYSFSHAQPENLNRRQASERLTICSVFIISSEEKYMLIQLFSESGLHVSTDFNFIWTWSLMVTVDSSAVTCWTSPFVIQGM